jgi:YesN/AraC family two-component response regulator
MSERKRILVIDDEEVTLESFKKILEQEGHIVDTAKDGNEAIEKSNTNFYNLALVDIRLPDMEGIALLTAMRDTVPKMVKIIVTGYPSVENAIEAVNKGVDGYIIKPVTNVDTFLKTIRGHLKKQEDAEKYAEERVEEFIETRIRKEPIVRSKPHSTKLEEALLEATDHGLLALGEIVRQTIYERVETNHQIKKGEIPENLETFHRALQVMLGAGAKVVERQITRNLYGRLGLNFIAHHDWTLVEYVNDAKRMRGGA